MNPPVWSIGTELTLAFLGNERFTVRQVLRGGMGEVYRLESSLGTSLALKTLQVQSDDQVFARECGNWLKVAAHRFIARPLGYGRIGDRRCIAMHWYSGTMNEEEVRKQGLKRLKNRIVEIVWALEYCFDSAHLIHQDIKPANVLLDHSGHAHVSDFGLARTLGTLGNPTKTQAKLGPGGLLSTAATGPHGGTPFFMAPELFDGVVASISSDIYALGVTAFTLLTGEHPYIEPDRNPGPRPALRIQSILKKWPTSSLASEWPSVRDFLEACLSLRPQSRAQSYSDLRSILSIGPGPSITSHDANSMAITAAALHREEGRSERSDRILEEAADRSQWDPALENSRMAQAMRRGDRVKAGQIALKAIERIDRSGDKMLLLRGTDLFVNYANLVREQGDHRGAAGILSHFKEKVPELVIRQYAEMAWLRLYRGDVSGACDALADHAQSRRLDRFHSMVFVQAAWMCDSIKRLQLVLWPIAIEMAKVDTGNALAAGVVAGCLDSDSVSELVGSIPLSIQAAIKGESRRLGVDLLCPRNRAHQAVIVRGMDQLTTGGRSANIS